MDTHKPLSVVPTQVREWIRSDSRTAKLRAGLLGLFLAAHPPTLIAQEPEGGGAIGIPRLIARLEDRDVSIELERLDATVRIVGFLAETTLVLTFHNTDPRLLEGEFLLALPDGATVSGYGLDVEGLLVDGVVVEKQKARIVFERETRRRIDPGVVEWLGGNLFRTRVYPIDGGARRTVKIQYVSQLELDRHEATYRLPLNAYPRLAQLRLRIEVIQPAREPTIVHHPLTQLDFERSSDRLVAEGVEHDLKAAERLEIRLPVGDAPIVVVEEVAPDLFAFAVSVFAGDLDLGEVRKASPGPEKLAIFWDASLSRQQHDHRQSLQVIAALLRTWRPREVALVAFRDQVDEPVMVQVRGGRSAELLKVLDNITYDGATSWNNLEIPAGFRAAAALVFSDGRISLGDRKVPVLGVPTYSFNSATDGDGPLLRELAESSGGAYFDLTRTSRKSLLRAVRTAPVTLRGHTVEQGTVREVIAPVGRPVAGATVVTGLMEGGHARLSLDFGAGDGDSRQVSFVVDARPGGALASRAWAQQKLARLTLHPERNREAILALGREHGLVTPGTSLLVLETLGQYLEYQVEPPAGLPEMRREYRARVRDLREDAHEGREQYLKQLRGAWQGYLVATQESYVFPVPGSLGPSRHRFEPELSGDGVLEVPDAARESEPADADPLAGRLALRQTVRGVVRSRDGFELPGAVVRLESESLLSPIDLVTDVDGSFHSPVLTPGRYSLLCTLDGFSTEERDFWLSRDAALRFDFDLGFGIEEYITVTAATLVDEIVEDGSEIVLQPWAADRPYLDVLQATPSVGLYDAYLSQRRVYRSSPAFYADCAQHFLERGLTREGLRIGSAVLDLRVGEPKLIRAAAGLAVQAKAWGRAVSLFERLAVLRPELPQSKRDLAVSLLLRGDARENADAATSGQDYRRAARLLHQVAFEPWGDVPEPLQLAYLDDGRFEEIGRIALVEHGWAMRKLRALPASGESLPDTDPGWLHLPDADLRIVVTWEDELADMDLWVIEPTGEKVSYANPRSAIGGQLSEDCTNGLGPESYALKRAMPGTYRIVVDYFGGADPDLLGPVTVEVMIQTGFGREGEEVRIQRISLEKQEGTVEVGSVTVGD